MENNTCMLAPNEPSPCNTLHRLQGNLAFATSYNALVPQTWRVVNAKDTVCTVPRMVS